MTETTDLVDEFLRAGVAAEQARQLAEQARQVAEKRRRKRTLAGLAIGLAMVSALAVAAGVSAYRERQQRIATESERDRAVAAERDAADQTIQLLAKTAEAEIERDPAQAVALALDALSFLHQHPDIQRVEPINALRRALAAGPSEQVPTPETEGLHGVSFSPDGRWLVATSGRGLVRWGIAGENGERFTGPDVFEEFGPITAVAFSPGVDQTLVALGGYEGQVWVSDLASPPITLYEEGIQFPSLAWSPDGKLLASSQWSAMVRVWRRPEPGASWGAPSLLHIAGASTRLEPLLAFSPDGDFLAAGGMQGVAVWPTASLFDEDQPPYQWLSCESAGVYSEWLLWQEDRLLFTGYDQDIGIIDLAARSPTCERWAEEAPPGLLTGQALLTLSPSGRWVVSWGGDNLLRLWSPETEQLELLRGHDGPVTAVAFSPDDRLLVSATFGGTVRLWALAPDAREPQVYLDAGQAAAFDDGGNLLTAGMHGDHAVVSTIQTPRTAEHVLETGKEHTIFVDRLSLQARWLALSFADPGGDTTHWNVWNLTTPASEPRFRIDGQALDTWSLSRDGQMLALGYRNGTIGLWELGEQAILRQSLPCAGKEVCRVEALAFDAAGELLAYAYHSADIYVLNVADLPEESQPLQFEGDSSRHLVAIALSPDGRRLASGYATGPVWLWNVDDPAQPPQQFQGPQDFTTSMAFSPDGNYLARGGERGVIYLWDLENPELAPQMLEGHHGGVESLVFSPDGRSLASADRNRSVRVWRVDEADLVEFARRWVQP